MMRPHLVPSSPAPEPDTERDLTRYAAFADTHPDLARAENELEDTQPCGTLPFDDDAFFDAPTLPGVDMEEVFASPAAPHASVRDGQWDRVLAAVAHAVRRVFATHSA